MIVNTIKTRGFVKFQIYKKATTFWDKLFRSVLKHFQFRRINLFFLYLKRFGTVREEWSVENTITNAGKAAIAGLVGNVGSITAFSYLEVGTSTTAPAASQTALQAAIVDSGLARHSATVSRVTTTQTNDTIQFLYVWTASGSKSVEEIGIFNASSAGIMLGRALSGTKAVDSGETLTATYGVQFL